MATSVRAVLGSSANTNSGNKTATATPTVGDLVVVLVGNTGQVATPSMSDNNADGLGSYTLVGSALKASSADRLCVFVRNSLIGSATSTVFTMAPGTTTGGFMVAIAVQGSTLAGAAAVRQIATQDNQTAGGTPAPVFAGPAQGINTLIGCVFNATNPATMTKPTSFDTERADAGYTTPDTGVEIVSDDTGNTDTTVTWGSTSASDFCAVVVELLAGHLVPIGAASETDGATGWRLRKAHAIAAVQETDTASAFTSQGRRSVAIGQAFETDTTPTAPISQPAKPQWGANVDFNVYEPLIGRTYDAIRDYVGMEDTPGTANRVIGSRRRLMSIKCYSPDGMIMYYVQGPDRNITSASWLNGRAHFEFDNVIHARVGKPVVIAGMTPSAYNGTWLVDSVVSSTQLNLVMANNPGTATVLGTGHAQGITQGAWDTQIDAWASWLAAQPAMDLVLHHEPDHLPGSFTEFPGRDAPGTDQADFKAANEYFWTRIKAGGVNPDLVKFGFCPIAATVRAGRAGLYFDSACHGFMAVDGYSGSSAVQFDDIFSGSDTFCAANSIDFYVWETNVNLGTDDQGEKDWWEALPALAESMNCVEVCLWIGTTQTMNPATEPLKFAGYTAAGLDPYFTDAPSGGATFTPSKSTAIGQAVETDAAQSWSADHGAGHHVNIGQVLETDLAQIFVPLLPTPPEIDTLEVIVPKSRRRVQLPAVAWVLGGIPVSVQDGWTANAVADGGMDKFSGYIPAATLLANPNKFRQGARLTGFVGSQQFVWDGLLTGDPVISAGVAKVEAAGQKTRAELASGRLLYQSRDFSNFQDGGDPPMNFTPVTDEIEGAVKASALFWHLIKDHAYSTDDAFPLAAWFSGALVTRVAADIAKSGNVTNAELRVQSFTGPSGSRTALHDYPLDSTGPASFDLNVAAPEDGIVFNVRFNGSATPAVERYIRLRNLRVNGIADGDEFFTSDVARDIGDRLGYDTRFKITDSGTNAMPFDLGTGTWSQEGLSYMSLLDDWRWLVLEDRGHGPILDYGPWERVWYVQRMQDAMPDFKPLPLYSQVVVRYKSAAGTLQQVTAVADPNPLAGTGRDSIWYEDLSDAQPDDSLATLVADALIAKLSIPRYTGAVDIVGARLASGTGNAYSVRPGDLLDVSDWVPAGHVRQRIVEVEYRSDGVRLGIEAPVTADGVISTFALERARRKKGKAFQGATG